MQVFDGQLRAVVDRMAQRQRSLPPPAVGPKANLLKLVPKDELAWVFGCPNGTNETGYDTMEIARVKGRRREVRRMLAQRSRELLARYRQGEAVSPGCPLQVAVANASPGGGRDE